MPPTETCLTKQAKRLIKLPFAPQDEEGARGLLEEYKRVLRPRCLTDAHCAAVVDYLVDHSQRCPPPAEVIVASEEVPAPDAQKAPEGCGACSGTGFVIVERGLTSAADFCRCGLGDFKRAAAARYQAERTAAKGAR